MNNTSDSIITFDENGYCNYCIEALKNKDLIYFPNQFGKEKLEKTIHEIKKKNSKKKYDCIMGVSGGIDSSYLLYLGYIWGLRILAVHVDDGYDTETCINNISKLINKTGVDYRVYKPDREQYNNLLLAYMKAGVPSLTIPQDNIINSFMEKMAYKHSINYYLSGSNFATESILQRGNAYDQTDLINIIDINKRFGKLPINKLNLYSTYKKYFYRILRNIIIVKPLNYIDYNFKDALKTLKKFCGFEYYGSKHLENYFTAFNQLVWLPKKFNVDKRTSHYSSLIVSNQMSRDDALKLLTEPPCDNIYLSECIKLICNNIGISKDYLNSLVHNKNHQHYEYKNMRSSFLYKLLTFVYKKIKL